MPKTLRRPEIGATLHIQISSDCRKWGNNPAPDGTPVKVLGFGRIEYGRTNALGIKPGVYLNRCWLDVELPGGKTHHISSYHVRWPDGSYPHDNDYDNREADRIGDLPETPIWEEDVVESPRDCDRWQYPNGLIVLGIDYAWVHGKHYARVSDSIDGGWSMSFRLDELTLKRRGPVWAYYHHEPLHLSDEELIKLHKRLGFAREQRNPRTGDYSWTVSEALEDIRADKADAMSAGQGMFGSGTTLSVYRFDDRTVAAKARKATLAGWADTTPEKLAEFDREHLERRARVDAMIREVESRRA